MRLGLAGFVAMAAPIWLLTLAAPRALAIVALFLFGIGGPLGVSPISATLTTRAPGEIRPQVVSAFLAITSAGTPLGAAATGYAIERAGFAPTYAGIAAAMTLAVIVLALAVRRMRALPAPLATPTPS
jgi:predicted MFS family arabinose efflux permease